MNRLLVGFGFVLILSGLIAISSANINVKEPRAQVVKTDKKVWAISANFTEGDKLIVTFVPGNKWSSLTDITDYYSHGVVWVYVKIVDPLGNATEFQVPWAKPVAGAIYLFPDPINLTVLEAGSLIDPGWIEIGAFGGCGGIAKYNGSYTVNIETYPRQLQPPAAIQFVKEIYIQLYPYSFALPIGGSILVCGLGISAYGVRLKLLKRKKKR